MPARTSLAVLFVLNAFAIGSAFGQTSSKDDGIVNSLKPTAPLGGSTRGIRFARFPSGDAVGPSFSLNIQFPSGSATLTPAAMHGLDELGREVSNPALATYHFRIEGHTDTVGTPSFNKSLSAQRADAVLSYLTGKYGIDPQRLTAVGMGEDGLLVATPDQTPEARNRRVLLVNVGS